MAETDRRSRFFEYDRDGLSDEEYAALPPLVKRGEDRAAVIDGVVAGWLTPSKVTRTKSVTLSMFAAVEAHFAAGGFILDRVALVDGNTDEPIDLAELLRHVEDRLKADSEPVEFRSRPDLFILLRDCRIDLCKCDELRIRPRFVPFWTRFAAATSFHAATFGDGPNFDAATFGEGADFGRANFGKRACFLCAIFGKDAHFENATFGDGADFSNATFGAGANFRDATFSEGADFIEAAFGEGAKFETVTFGENTRFVEATFGEGANFEFATFGKGANFEFATFAKGARFRGSVLPHADLRGIRGFVPDETMTRGAHFSARARDAWSRLRSAYTGPRLIFNLLFLALFFTPFIARTMGWVAAARAESQVEVVLDAMDEGLREHEAAHPEVVPLLRDQVQALRRTLPGRDSERWRESRVWKAVLGADRGPALWLPAVLLLMYNIGRGFLTFIIAPMRDAEERSGYTPVLRPGTWRWVRGGLERELKGGGASGLKSRFPLFHVVATRRWMCGFLEAYGWLIWPHRVLTGLLFFAVLSFLYNASILLSLPVWIPK